VRYGNKHWQISNYRGKTGQKQSKARQYTGQQKRIALLFVFVYVVFVCFLSRWFYVVCLFLGGL
jgi:hypothetical protein